MQTNESESPTAKSGAPRKPKLVEAGKTEASSGALPAALHALVEGAVKQYGTLDEALQAVREQIEDGLRLGVEAVLVEMGKREATCCPPTLPCHCGRSTLRLSGRQRPRYLDLAFGKVSFNRPYYAPGPGCNCSGRHPMDEQLALPRGPLSSDVFQLITLLTVIVPFETAIDLLERLCGFTMSKKRAVCIVRKIAESAIEQEQVIAEARWEQRSAHIASRPPPEKRHGTLFVMVDGTSVGIQCQEEFKECKSAILFWESDMEPTRPRSRRRKRSRKIVRKRIVSHVGSHETFLPFLWNAFVEVGGLTAEQIVWSGDGIEWIWNDGLKMLPEGEFNVVELLDWYHLFQNLWKAARAAYKDPQEQARWIAATKKKMRRRNTGKELVAELEELWRRCPETGDRDIIWLVRNYVEFHSNRMRYADFKTRDWPRGSAAIESVQHGVIQARFKLPGMRWTVDGVNRLLRLRNAYFSKRWDEVFAGAVANLLHAPPPDPERDDYDNAA